MSDERLNEMLDTVRSAYNEPPDVPRDAIWRSIEASVGLERPSDITDLDNVRGARGASARRYLGWAVGLAATGLVAVGVGIGRLTGPGGVGTSAANTELAAESYAFATGEYLGRSEALLTMVRADARQGVIDPGTGAWARSLLSQTRLLLDARTGAKPAMAELLEDLELVLVQIVGVAETGSMDAPRARAELGLALRGLEESEVLPRLEAATPTYGFSGS